MVHLQHDSTCARWPDAEWHRWPHCSRAVDQGGDGMCGMAAAKYLLKLNVTDIYDWAHGVCRDWEAAITVVNRWPFTSLVMVLENLAHGPEKDELLR